MRHALAALAGLLLLGVSTACGTVAPSPEAAPTGSLGGAGAAVTSTPAPSPAAEAPTPPPTAEGIVDPFAQRALADTRERVAIRSGTPTVRLSRPVTAADLRALGIGDWRFAPGCAPPLHLVILHGDFDVRPSQPASLAPGARIPARFVAYVYDADAAEQIALLSDPSGARFKRALGDPDLPDPTAAPGVHPAQVPCQPTTLPGGPTRPGGPVPTPGRPEVGVTAMATRATTAPPHPRTTDPDVPAAAPASGVPTIHPRRVSTGPGAPTFTEQEVRDHLQRHPIVVRGLRATGPVVERVEFVPGHTLGAPDDPLLCVVTVRGGFHRSGGPAPPPGATPGPPARYDRVTPRFAAHTGDLWGGNASRADTPTKERRGAVRLGVLPPSPAERRGRPGRAVTVAHRRRL